MKRAVFDATLMSATSAASFLASLPIAELPGVGKGTLEKLRREGVGGGVDSMEPACADALMPCDADSDCVGGSECFGLDETIPDHVIFEALMHTALFEHQEPYTAAGCRCGANATNVLEPFGGVPNHGACSSGYALTGARDPEAQCGANTVDHMV